jgi:carbonic anhydrase
MLKTCVALLLCLLAFAAFLAAQRILPVCTPVTGDPLGALRSVNIRYAGDPPNVRPRPHPLHFNQSVACAKTRAGSQQPFAVILSCSDSRVPPEVIFDLGIGDLFVAREAGNVATPGVLGSIEYAVGHFKTKLVVVLGHKRCGAVEAAFCKKEPEEYIRTLWRLIRPAAGNVDAPGCPNKPEVDPEEWDQAVRKNVDNMATKVGEDLKGKPGWGDVTVVRAYYDLDNGKVDLPMVIPVKK